jgi:hypothetical protein
MMACTNYIYRYSSVQRAHKVLWLTEALSLALLHISFVRLVHFFATRFLADRGSIRKRVKPPRSWEAALEVLKVCVQSKMHF